MRLVLLGPPGAGKGTQAQVLSQDLSAAHISTGDMLREAIRKGTPLGLKAKQLMDQGLLVPDEVVISLVIERLKNPDTDNGFILDGFPRTVAQAIKLDENLKAIGKPLDMVLYFKTSLEIILMRLTGRRVCSSCGKTYHIRNFKPKQEGICDVCSGKLTQRPDDEEGTIKKRLAVYEHDTLPLIEYYKKSGRVEEVSGDLEVNDLNRVLEVLFRKKGFAQVKLR